MSALMVLTSVRLYFGADSAAYWQAGISRKRDDPEWLERYASGARSGAVLMAVLGVMLIIRVLTGAQW